MIKPLTLTAGLAWAAAAISTATPAGAVARFYQPAPASYATCAASWLPRTPFTDECGYSYNYKQAIKLNSTTCNQGACAQPDIWTEVTWRYSVSRKTAALQVTCGPWAVYAFGDCAC